MRYIVFVTKACLWNSLNTTISSLTNLNTLKCIFNFYSNCLYVSVAKASDTQAVGHDFEPSPHH